MHRGVRYYGRTGTLTIGSILLNGPAWDIPDLTPLWTEFKVDGEDVELPGADGAVPHQRFLKPGLYALPMVISGDVDPDGDDYSDAWVGLETNLGLLSPIVLPTGMGDGTQAATLAMPSGATRTANVHVLGLKVGASQGTPTGLHARMAAVLQLSVPAGRFAGTAS